jgi:hypothetical protein
VLTSVFCAVGTTSLYIICIKFRLQRFKGNILIFTKMKCFRDVKMLKPRTTVATRDLTDKFSQILEEHAIQNANSSDLEWSTAL